jgi:hypothetical protein
MDPSWSADAVAAEFSRLAYVRFEVGEAYRQIVADSVRQLGYGDTGFFHDPRQGEARKLDAQGFAARSEAGDAIIAFRGTQPDSLHDLWSDANAAPAPWPGGGWVHRGILEALESLLPQVESWLAGHSIGRVTVTGHSLGAAMATLLAARLGSAELITIGSPRVGNGDFARALEGRQVRRYVDCTDMVTDLPPALGYAHLGALHYIDADGKVHLPGASLPSLARDHLKANADYLASVLRLGNVPMRALADHAPINYVSAMLGRRTGP